MLDHPPRLILLSMPLDGILIITHLNKVADGILKLGHIFISPVRTFKGTHGKQLIFIVGMWHKEET